MRVPDLNWPADLFDDAVVPNEPSFVPPTRTLEEPIWHAMRSRWTGRRPATESRMPPFRPVLRANGFGAAA